MTRFTPNSVFSMYLATLGLVLGLCLPGLASAAEPTEEPLPQAFGGAFAEVSVRGGPTLSAAAGSGWSLDAGFRNSLPFYIGDNRIAYGFRHYSPEDEPLQLHSLHFTLGLHPLYLALLGRGLISHFLASLHLELGVGPQLGIFRDSAGESTANWAIAASVGAGFDLPLTNPNRGHGLWLNANYRRTWTTLAMEIDAERASLHDHGFFLGLAWRLNGSIW